MNQRVIAFRFAALLASRIISNRDLARGRIHIDLRGLPRGQARAVTRDGRKVEPGGCGNPAVMRPWLVRALTGRRASEVLMMDFEPLSEVPGLERASAPDGGMV